MQNNYDNRRPVGNDVVYAGFWVRLAAYFLDSVLVFFMLLIVRLALSGVMSIVRGTVLGGNILFHYTLKDIVLYLAQVLYFILCTRYTGTTVGKKALNLRVINADGSMELDFLNVVYRETVGRFLCSLPMGIGYFIAGLDKEKRGIHDMLCDTRVVYAKKVKTYPVYYPPMPPVQGPMAQPGGVPPMRSGMPNQPGPRPMPPMGVGPSEPRGTVGTFPGYPANQPGPYRMVPPKEQNLHPSRENVFEEKQENSDKEGKLYSGIEEKEDSNRS